ncbi:Broad-range acid phosphatase-like protein [Hapsidospora chrysogenum ATCC 11550]|uniref:Broad-range acid phosphatase-like protein n=1 Tax=Hapsidospora chrysogenum (strain ATCC 11550 / CBS 779.69 / DSM 880 / IAM 14645 / JCM 23072 / IMI 49137) TaxID=857340 RepID=A0A086T602_HAPC1|nr:Broad-range acid phosphatase-like protein [Hapsidospora chrysogenum ATCC 11550]
MAKPRLIILIRHAQSEGNKNREIHQSTPDHRVKLTPEGKQQAREAGRRLRSLLRPDDTLHFFTSPYRRTRETTEGILDTLTSDEPGPSPFRRSNIKVYEEPRLREQDFGNFQPCSAEMERMWQERADYGHFFYRIPNGESAADAYDRVSGFNESLWRQFGEDSFASVCVLVTHGLMSRVFLMKWYHFTVEYFEDLRNVNHCEFLIMRKQDNGKYLLENQLRTWSDLRRERALKDLREARERPNGKLDRTKTSPSTTAITTPRRWGGCPNGCNHSSHYIRKREDLEQLRQKDEERAAAATSTTTTTAAGATTPGRHRHKNGLSSDEDDDYPHSDAQVTPRMGIVRRATATVEEHLSSPPETSPPSFTAGRDRSVSGTTRRLSRLHVGRDGGGTYSGHASTVGSVGSDTDASEDERQRQQQQLHHRSSHRRVDSLNARIRIANAESLQNKLEKAAAEKDEEGEEEEEEEEEEDAQDGGAATASSAAAASAAPRGTEGKDHATELAFANRLGDAPQGADPGSDGQGDEADEDLDKAEAHDRSIRGSVY